MFRDPVISEELINIRSRKAECLSELAKLESIYEERKDKLTAKTKKFFYGAWAFTTLQLGVGYHAIYNVEWIGWDLVEPVTYSIG